MMDDDGDSCVMKYIEIIPREDYSQSTDVKFSPRRVNEEMIVKTDVSDTLHTNSHDSDSGVAHENQNTAVPFVWYKTPEDWTSSANPECGPRHDERKTLSTSLTDDVYASEHVDNEEEDDVLCSLISAHFNSVASATIRDAHTVVEVDGMGESTSEKARDQLSHNSNNIENHGFEKPIAPNLSYQSFSPFLVYIPSDCMLSQSPTPQPFSCEVCHRHFTQECDLQVHMRTHAEDKQCDVSNKQFASSSSAKSRMPTHTGNKPFSCEVCNKQFAWSGSLKSHMLFHTGDKPFSCKVCHKRFARRGSVTVHMRIHTGDKPFSCKVCQKRFTQSGSVTEHMRIHTGEKPFNCDVCDKQFTHRSAFKSHRLTHSKRTADLQ